MVLVERDDFEHVAAEFGAGEVFPRELDPAEFGEVVGEVGALDAAGGLEAVAHAPVGLVEIAVHADDAGAGAEADVQFVPVKGLGEEVVVAGAHAGDDVVLLGLGGEHDDVDVVHLLVGTDALDQFEAADVGHHPVGDHDGEAVLLEQFPSLVAVRGGGDLVTPAFEVGLELETGDLVVLGDEDADAGFFTFLLLFGLLPVRRRRGGRGGFLEQVAEFSREVGGGGVAVADLFGHGAEADALEFARDALGELAGRPRFVLDHGLHEFGDVAGLERELAGDHAVKDDAERVDVGAAVDAMALSLRLFGRHVVGRAGDLAAGAPVHAGAGRAEREAEVHEDGDVRLTAARHDDVGRFDVAVDDALGVGGGEPVGDDGDREFPARPMVEHPVVQVLAFQKFGNDEQAVVVASDVVHRDDVGVADLRHLAGFLQKRVGVHAAGQQAGPDDRDLDGDVAPEGFVPTQIDDAERAATKRAIDGVATDLRRPVGDGGRTAVRSVRIAGHGRTHGFAELVDRDVRLRVAMRFRIVVFVEFDGAGHVGVRV